MKSESQIRQRLEKLRVRYTTKYMEASQCRSYLNCVYNLKHQTQKLKYKDSDLVLTEYEMYPKSVSSLVVINPDSDSVHLCIYGSENPETWNGDICDTDEVAKECPMFKPWKSIKEAREEFEALLEDDQYIYRNHPDIAALQWALNIRLHQYKIPWYYRLILWIKSKFIRTEPVVPKSLPPGDPEELWSSKHDTLSNSGT